MIRRITPMVAFVALIALGFALGACAPEQQVKQAKRAVDSARSVHADYLAPYYFASAEEYLAEAVSQLHESDFRSASRFAAKSKAQAVEAERIARTAHARPMVPYFEGALPAEEAIPMTDDALPPVDEPAAAPPVTAPPVAAPPAPVAPPPPPVPDKNITDEYPLGEPDDLPPVDEPEDDEGDE
jgi:Domain of unknown function (DUF4398)